MSVANTANVRIGVFFGYSVSASTKSLFLRVLDKVALDNRNHAEVSPFLPFDV